MCMPYGVSIFYYAYTRSLQEWKKVNDFLVPSQDAFYQALPGRE